MAKYNQLLRIEEELEIQPISWKKASNKIIFVIVF
jgi:enolase